MTVVLTGHDLSLADVVSVARGGERVELAAAAHARIVAGRGLVDRALAAGDEVYGLTTGVGVRKRFRVAPGDDPGYARRLIAAHRVGQGPPASRDVVRAMALRLANELARGTFAVRPATVALLVDALNEDRLPEVRMLGSTGQGDVAQHADLAAGVLAGVELAPGEAHAFISNGAYSTAVGALAIADAARLADTLDLSLALDLEAFAANLSIVHPVVAETRPSPGLAVTLLRVREMLEGSRLWDPGAARNLQDPLSFRTAPQVHGALRDALEFAQRQLAVELNAVQINPLAVPAEGRFVSVGSFDLLPLAAALDVVRLGLAPAVTSACERALKLLQAPQSGLPEGLAARGGLVECGLSELAFTLQGLTAEARLLAQPVSFEAVSTTGAEGIEDRLSMAPLAGRRLAEMVTLAERVVALELVVAAQAIDLRGQAPLGAGAAAAHARIRGIVPFVGDGETIPADLEALVEAVRSGSFRGSAPPGPAAEGRLVTDDIARFYDTISDRYHLLQGDRRAWVETTGAALERLIAALAGPGPHRILDCSCGIGTQAIELARRGHEVTGTDLSEGALARASREAAAGGLTLRTAVADMRRLQDAVAGPFDVVLSCDNSVAHLDPSELRTAVTEMAGVLRPDGVALVSVRDYGPLLAERPRFTTAAAAADGSAVAFQLWDWEDDGSSYSMRQFFLEEHGGRWETTCERTTLHVHLRETILGAFVDGGLDDVRWHVPAQTGYYQPIATGRRR